MPFKLTPEYRRAYRARCIAENRCANCGIARAPEDTATLSCARCRATKNAGSARRYADTRAASPPDFDRGDPHQSFRYGKTRLKNPRYLSVVLDTAAAEVLFILKESFVYTPHYEPYQNSELVRRALRVLQHRTETFPCRGFRLSRCQVSQWTLHFKCDEDNLALLKRQCDRHGCTRAAALRDLFLYAAHLLLFGYPNEYARRILFDPAAQNTPVELPPMEPHRTEMMNELRLRLYEPPPRAPQYRLQCKRDKNYDW